MVVEVPKVNSSSLCCSSFSNKIETKLSMTINGKNIEKYVGCAFANFGNSSGTEVDPNQKREKNGRKKKNKSMLPRPGIEPGTHR